MERFTRTVRRRRSDGRDARRSEISFRPYSLGRAVAIFIVSTLRALAAQTELEPIARFWTYSPVSRFARGNEVGRYRNNTDCCVLNHIATLRLMKINKNSLRIIRPTTVHGKSSSLFVLFFFFNKNNIPVYLGRLDPQTLFFSPYERIDKIVFILNFPVGGASCIRRFVYDVN